jgi:hypothetical protein
MKKGKKRKVKMQNKLPVLEYHGSFPENVDDPKMNVSVSYV